MNPSVELLGLVDAMEKSAAKLGLKALKMLSHAAVPDAKALANVGTNLVSRTNRQLSTLLPKIIGNPAREQKILNAASNRLQNMKNVSYYNLDNYSTNLLKRPNLAEAVQELSWKYGLRP